MSGNIIVQYLGFEVSALVREYFFKVRGVETELQEFSLTIPNEAFVSHRMRLQDAPDLCSLKIQRELAACANHPPMTHFSITNTELDDYRASHTHKPGKRLKEKQ
jgi:hypothetical protein